MAGFLGRLSSYFSGGFATDATAGRRRFLANVDELADGQMKEVALEADDGRPLKVLLSRVQGDFYATSHLCPHYKARLVTGALSASGRLTCPWHAACFDVRTGDIEEAPSVEALRSFPLCVEEGKVYLLAADKDLAVSSRSVCGPLQLSPADLERDGRTFVVVGGGAAGAIAAESMRKAGYKGRIVVISREPHLPIDRTKLSKYLDIKPDRAALFKAPYLLDQLQIEFHLGKVAGALACLALTINDVTRFLS